VARQQIKSGQKKNPPQSKGYNRTGARKKKTKKQTGSNFVRTISRPMARILI
jgi:hypothetical protein